MLARKFRLNPLLLIVLISIVNIPLWAQSIENIKTTIENERIIIEYDLISNTSNSIYDITVLFGNSTVQNNVLKLASGDIGKGIFEGAGKKIIISELTLLNPYLEDLIFRIEVKKSSAAELASISISTQPKGATVYLDNVDVGMTDIVVQDLKPGQYHIKIKLKGYLSIEKDIELILGEPTHLNETFIKGYKSSINSSPEGAAISLNGELLGSTPIQVALQQGENEIILTEKYYHDFSKVIVPRRQDKKYSFDLEQKEYEVKLISYPKSTKIHIDGELYNDGETLVLPGGKTDIIISKNNFYSYDGTFVVKDKEELQNAYFLIEPNHYRTKPIALLYSLLFPGYGQRYLKRSGYEPIMGVASYGLLIGSVVMNNNAVESYDLYLKETNSGVRDDLNQQWQDQKKQSEYMLYGAGAIWVTNLIWTLLVDSESKRYQKVKTQLKFDNLAQSYNLGVSIPIYSGN